jgi:hypothetical protein
MVQTLSRRKTQRPPRTLVRHSPHRVRYTAAPPWTAVMAAASPSLKVTPKAQQAEWWGQG